MEIITIALCESYYYVNGFAMVCDGDNKSVTATEDEE
jgi:hypothetical protein